MATTAQIDILLKTVSDLKGVSEMGEKIGELKHMFMEFTGIGLSIEAGKEFVKQIIEYSDRIVDLSRRLEMSTTAFQKMAFAARETGLEQEKLVVSLGHLKANIDNAATNGGRMSAAFHKLGLDAKVLAGVPLERALEAIGYQMVHADDKTQAYALACEILGTKNVPKLIEMLKRLGVEGFDEVTKHARIISQEDLLRIHEFKESVERLGDAARVFGAAKVAGVLDVESLHMLAEAMPDNTALEKLNKYKAAITWLKADLEAMKRSGFGWIGSMIDIPQISLFEYKIKNLREELKKLGIDENPKSKELEKPKAVEESQESVSSAKQLEDLGRSLLQAEAKRKEIREWTINKFGDAYYAKTLAGLSDELRVRNAIVRNLESESAKYPEIDKQTEEQKKKTAELSVQHEKINALLAERFHLRHDEMSQLEREKEASVGINNPGVNKGFIPVGQSVQVGALQWVNQLGSVGQQISGVIKNQIGGAITSVSDAITSAIMRTKSWGQAFAQLGSMMLGSLVKAAVDMTVQWVAQEVIRTTAHATAESTQTAITIGNTAKRTTANSGESLSNVIKAATGAGSSVASVPYIGPILALAAIATIFAAGMAIVGKREFGGPVTAGQAYIVGERRPEVFVPGQSGYIVPSVGQYVGQAGFAGGGRGNAGAGSGGQAQQTHVALGIFDKSTNVEDFLFSNKGHRMIYDKVRGIMRDMS